MIRAAGTMYITAANEVLYLKRGPGGDYPGFWCFPGGKIEDGETASQAADRECIEELGFLPKGTKQYWTRRIAPRDAHVYKDEGLPNQIHSQEGASLPGEPGPNEEVDFTTFVQRVPERFEPQLNGEHTGFAWALATEPPEPLHPGARIALDRLTMDELGIARAMAAGDLTSPQRYGSFWLWNIRITGTGLAYRGAHKDPNTGKVLREEEYCWRDGSIYLNDDFLARCGGLQVILDHPIKKAKLDSTEFNRRSVGAVFVPFIRGEEVWAVAKVYDKDCNEWMLAERASTSPGVVFSAASGNETLKSSDGMNFLIEGDPELLDHIALVPNGVWDKGGPPVGVQNDSLDDTTIPTTQEPIGMTEEEKAAADKARKDAEAKLDAIMDGFKRMDARLDSMEQDAKSRKDAAEEEKKRADSARRDAARKDRFGARKDGETDDQFKARCDADEEADRKDSEEDGDTAEAAADKAKSRRADAVARDDEARKDAAEEKERADKARADAAVTQENADLKARLAAMEATIKGITTETPAGERDALAAAQSRADSVAGMFGDRASPPIPGETPLAYRKRLLGRFQRHSDRFKESRFDSLDGAMLGTIEDVVYADAAVAARNPSSPSPGVLIPIVTRENGRDVTRFTGDIMTWMAPFMTAGNVGHVLRNPNQGA